MASKSGFCFCAGSVDFPITMKSTLSLSESKWPARWTVTMVSIKGSSMKIRWLHERCYDTTESETISDYECYAMIAQGSPLWVGSNHNGSGNSTVELNIWIYPVVCFLCLKCHQSSFYVEISDGTWLHATWSKSTFPLNQEGLNKKWHSFSS